MNAPVRPDSPHVTRHADDREHHLHPGDKLDASPVPQKSSLFSENRILAALPFTTCKQLLPHLELVHLPAGRILYNAGDLPQHAYFPISGVVAMLSTVEDGGAITAALICNDGMVGVSVILKAITLPYQMVVAARGEALRVRVDTLKAELGRNSQLQDSLLRYTHTVLNQLAHSVACNRFHTVEARLCRWLLVNHDCLQTKTLNLTQEFLSYLMGVPRTSITTITGGLQRAGLIRCSRGRIELIDRKGLERLSCECYRTVREEESRFLAA